MTICSKVLLRHLLIIFPKKFFNVIGVGAQILNLGSVQEAKKKKDRKLWLVSKKNQHWIFWKWSKMDSRIGLDYIVENSEYTTKLGAGKNPNPW